MTGNILIMHLRNLQMQKEEWLKMTASIKIKGWRKKLAILFSIWILINPSTHTQGCSPLRTQCPQNYTVIPNPWLLLWYLKIICSKTPFPRFWSFSLCIIHNAPALHALFCLTYSFVLISVFHLWGNVKYYPGEYKTHRSHEVYWLFLCYPRNNFRPGIMSFILFTFTNKII